VEIEVGSVDQRLQLPSCPGECRRHDSTGGMRCAELGDLRTRSPPRLGGRGGSSGHPHPQYKARR
jgi:hypothetical protein